jgi:hypothetical protein
MGDMGATAALATAATLARPAVRTGLLSGPYQKLMTTPSYQSMLAKALENKITREGIRAGTLAGLPHLMQE